ncbi:hypothetical protein [Clostridium tagluense]|uniref:hypothetical protein n=1 Tax=Clostridium tagluense TaxID=360422 RepID=UPI0021639B60|nr:hypothetical protein [Clostridium tagluense]
MSKQFVKGNVYVFTTKKFKADEAIKNTNTKKAAGWQKLMDTKLILKIGRAEGME